MKTIAVSLFSLLMFSGTSHAVQVTFSGAWGNSTYPALGSTPQFSGSFTLDESVIATDAPIPSGNPVFAFIGVVDNFIFNIAGQTFTGENGNLKQTSSGYFTAIIGSSGETKFGNLNGSLGDEFMRPPTISGARGPNVLRTVSLNMNLINDYLPDGPRVLIKNQGLENFSLSIANLTLGFINDWGGISVIRNRPTTLDFGSSGDNPDLSSVPIPVSVWLFVSGILGLSGLASHKRHTAKLFG